MQTYTTEQLVNLNSSELLNLLERLRYSASHKGAEWAEKRHVYQSIKEMLPSYLAEIQRMEIERGVKSTDAKVKALASPTYMSKVTAMTKAQREMDLMEVEYKGLMESLKAITSISYLRNNEIKLSR